MSETPNNERKKCRTELFYFICFWFCISILIVLLYISGLAPIKKYELGDSDCYMRLIRVRELYNTGRWYDPVIRRSNAPDGERSHWTRPFDVLLLAGAVPLSLFTNFESALFWWGVIISPVLMIAAIVALQWSTRPILKEDGPFLAGFIFVFQIIIFTYFQPGRPDHHSLLIFFFVLSAGFALRMILRPFNAFVCYMAGAVGALSIWVSVESMLTICIIMAVLGLLWILKNDDFLQKSLHYSLALFVFTAVSMILERPWYDLTTQQFDRLSIVHWGIFGFIAAFWILSMIFDRYEGLFHRMPHRFSFILAGVAATALLTLICFPKFYKGPMADVDPRIIPIWLHKVREVQPLLSSSYFVIPLQLFGSAVLCFPFLCYLMLKERRHESWNGWLFISLAAVIFILISLYQIRWSAYAQTLLIMPMTALMVLLRQRGPKTGLLKTLKNVFIVMTFSFGFMLLGLLADVIFKKGDSEKSRQKVSLIRMCEYLNEAERLRGRNYRILTDIDFGAEILYRTRHEVIGTPYHRNSPGILDTYDIMTADTDQAAQSLIRKRNINLILLCPKSTESVIYSKPEQTSTFCQRLGKDLISGWLRKVELPPDLSSSFFLFETIE
jgi:hypothetical protein